MSYMLRNRTISLGNAGDEMMRFTRGHFPRSYVPPAPRSGADMHHLAHQEVSQLLTRGVQRIAARPSQCRRLCRPARAAHSASNPGPASAIGLEKQPASFADAFWRFCRPHTMYGTTISILSISALALQSQPTIAWGAALTGLAQALVAALLMNISIVGCNQISDVEIDKVNKPYLPLASGEFSMQTGWVITVGTALLSLAIGALSNSLPLMTTLSVSLLLGILYSVELPFMRWKRSPVLAAACILAVRALVVQLGFFFHMQSALASPAAAALGSAAAPFSLWAPSTWLAGATVTPAIAFTVCFMLLFSVVIALFKDIPDALGDRRAGIQTLTVRLGVPRVFWTCIWILTTAYVGAVTYSVLAAHFWSAAGAGVMAAGGMAAGAGVGAGAGAGAHLLGAAMPASLSLIGGSGGNLGLRVLACVSGHCVLAGLLWQRALKTDLTSNADISACYMHVWKLFYSEYVLIPLLL